MYRSVALNSIKWISARVIAAPAFVLPYKPRALYIRALSAVVHAPFDAFGALARYFLRTLNIKPKALPIAPAPMPRIASPAAAGKGDAMAILFSGGTDSTCAASLAAKAYAEVHLLTFEEYATRGSPIPLDNMRRLEKHFPDVRFSHTLLSVDKLVRFFSYERYGHFVGRYGLLALSTSGFSSLSWHVRAIVYCLEHGITHVSDGLTRELMHFPGHMDAVIAEYRALYAAFGISYENPVRQWQVPEDQQLIDKVIVNRHGGEFFLGDEARDMRKTTGQYLYEQGIFPSPNVKGSRMDFAMQHECYPFALYNIVAFWGFMSFGTYEEFCDGVHAIMKEKIGRAQDLLIEYRNGKNTSRLARMLT